MKCSLEAQQRNENPSPPERPAAQPFDSHPTDLKEEPAPSLASPLQSANRPATANRAESLPDPMPFPDYSSLVSRSRDLLDGKYDTTPEGRREANSLLTDLELMEPPASKPPKGARASVIEHMKRWIASRRESLSAANVYPQDELRGAEKVQELSPANKVQRESRDLSFASPLNQVAPPSSASATPETTLREDHFVAPPSSRHAEPEFPITGVSQQTQLDQKTSPTQPLHEKPASPPRNHPERPPKPRPEAPFETKASLWDGRYRPPTFVDPLKRPSAFERKLRRMSSYRFRRFLELQHAKSFFD